MAIRFDTIQLAGTTNHSFPTIDGFNHGTNVRIATQYGTVDIGAGNSSYAHITTDRPQFYLNAKLVVDSGQIFSYDEDLLLARANSNATINLGEDSNATNDAHITMKVGEKKGLVMQNGSNYLTKYLHSVRTDSASPSHTTYYQWYTLKNPAGYSAQGLASSFKVKIYTAGKHANGSTYSEYLIRSHNANNQGTSGMVNTEVFCLLRTGYGDGYGGGTQDVTFYHRTSLSGWNNGEIIFSLTRANREPIDVIKIEPIGADTSIDYMPTLVSHGGGTGANDGRPTTNITAINMQYGGLHRTSSTDGRLLIDVNGQGTNTAHEIARFVNTESGANSSYMYIGATSGTDWRLGKAVFGTGSDFYIAKHSGTTAAISINSTGNGYVGIGVNSASSPLEVAGNGTIAKFNSAGSYSDIIFTNSSGTGGFLNFGGTTSFNVYVGGGSGGNLEMSLTNTGTLTVAGDVVAFGSPSDIRLKENIKPIESALDKVMNLKGVTFDWKDKEDALDRDGNPVKLKKWKNDIGFIAQEVKEVVPELVRENKEGMLSVRHQGVTPILLEAIKELKAEIEELKKHKCNCNGITK